MAHKKASHLAPEEANASGPLYVEHVFSAGVTPETEFSLFFPSQEVSLG